MSLAKLAAPAQSHPAHSVPAGYVAATAVLALLGLGLLVFLQAVTPPGVPAHVLLELLRACLAAERQHSPGWRQRLQATSDHTSSGAASSLPQWTVPPAHCAGPARVMSIIAVLIYGIMACLSTLYPTVGSMWVGAVWLVLLGMAVAAVVGLLVGFLAMPSLASDEVSTALLCWADVLCAVAGDQHAAHTGLCEPLASWGRPVTVACCAEINVCCWSCCWSFCCCPAAAGVAADSGGPAGGWHSAVVPLLAANGRSADSRRRNRQRRQPACICSNMAATQGRCCHPAARGGAPQAASEATAAARRVGVPASKAHAAASSQQH